MAQVELLAEATKFIERTPKMTIGGAAVDAQSGQSFDVMNPSTGEKLTEVPRGSREDIDAAVGAARAAFEDKRWSGLRPGKRTDVLYKI
ncbi:MAG: aldehyde dehydrogenase family protein, partial [Actinomycetota bacterium]